MAVDLIRRVCGDTLMFRRAVDSLLSDKCGDPVAFCDRMHEVWAAAARLYLDQVEMSRCTLDGLNGKTEISEPHAVTNAGEEPAETELRIRARLRAYLEQLTIWNRYDLRNAMPASRGLRTKGDYIDALALHLPEIYAETIRLEDRARRFLTSPSEAVLSQAIVSAEHLGKNHISYVLPALEWLTEEDAWQ